MRSWLNRLEAKQSRGQKLCSFEVIGYSPRKLILMLLIEYKDILHA